MPNQNLGSDPGELIINDPGPGPMINAIKNIATKVKAMVLCFCCLSLGILSDNLLFQTNMSNLSILYLSRMLI